MRSATGHGALSAAVTVPDAFALPAAVRRWCAVLGVAGAVSFVSGLLLAPARAWSAFLVGAFYFLVLALGSVVFLALHSISKAGWHTALKRVPEAIAGYVPVGAVTMLVLLAGTPTLYHWASAEAHHDPILQAKHGFLNIPFFVARTVGVLLIWGGMTAALRRLSSRQDEDHRVAHTHRAVALSAVFLVVFAYTFSLASVDWLMSLEPHWQSTMYGFYNLSGLLVGGVAAITVGTVVLRRMGLLPAVGPAHLHDLGKLLFGFSTFWAYIWVSQYLLVWYANLPEETPHYLTRAQGGWSFLFWANLVLGWLLPFVALLPAPAKRSETNLLWVSAFLLIGRWLDVYLLVAPATAPQHQGIGVIEIGTFAGFLGLFVFTVGRALESRPVVPLADPYMVESLHHG